MQSLRIYVAGGAALLLLAILPGCGGDSASFPTVTPETTIAIPVEFGTPTGEEFQRRQSVFPVGLLLPKTDVQVWTTVRREGDPATDDEVTFIVEGFAEAREGFFMDYVVTLTDEQDNVYETEPRLDLGLLAPGDRRKFELRAPLPPDARIKLITLNSGDGDKSRNVTYHVDLQVARIPTVPLLPAGYENAE
jgi:hypothetical protein